ncbi:hypothetical protein [Nocardia wallacei]|uniref:hypothetical protein n=1 Tax=Nocardia wallacei TaxID=480035 RepID=UPI0024540431|nr:hypothetical protein [Nocardia wallacei]
MNGSNALSIERGRDGFVGLYGDQSCSPEVYRIMLEIGHDIRSPQGGPSTVAGLEAAFPVWIVERGPWSRWYIHKSSRADWRSQRPAVDRAAEVLRSHGYEVAVAEDTTETGG